MTDEELLTLWRQAKAGDAAAREQIIVHYLPVVRRVSGKQWRSLPSHIELDDVVQYGTEGLLRAVKTYDPEQGTPFETYSQHAIRGVILDKLREMDWAPRSLRRRQREVDRARTTYQAMYGRDPSHSELDEMLGWERGSTSETIRATQGAHVVSLDEQIDAGTTPEIPIASGDINDILSMAVRRIRQLPEDEQLVIVLYYYEGLTLAKVAAVVGSTESKVSAINIRFTQEMRELLMDALGGDEQWGT